MASCFLSASARGIEGRSKAQRSLLFVIQKHQATQLHHDFRLGRKGVLKSRAVARGPSYDLADKRLAVQVEDHPIEYAGFEGTIPKGQHGGGTVMIWDQGTWEPHVDTLHGEKLQGDWVLLRVNGRSLRVTKRNWFLIKERDAFMRTAQMRAVTEASPDSVVTGRDLEQIASDEDHVWNSGESSCRGAKTTEPSRPSGLSLKKTDTLLHSDARLLRNLRRDFIPPQLALAIKKPPETDAWLHELKLDGYRIQIHVREIKSRGNLVRSATLLTRNGLNWTARMPEIARAAERLPVKAVQLDREVVALEPSGQTSFAALQEGRRERLLYFALDFLHLDGHNLRNLPMTRRKDILAGRLKDSNEDAIIRLSESFHVSGREVFSKAFQLNAEGIISKLVESTYDSGHSGVWLKIKCGRKQEFVIGGFTPPFKGGHGIAALLLSYYEDDRLIYAGWSGTGFTHMMHALCATGSPSCAKRIRRL